MTQEISDPQRLQAQALTVGYFMALLDHEKPMLTEAQIVSKARLIPAGAAYPEMCWTAYVQARTRFDSDQQQFENEARKWIETTAAQALEARTGQMVELLRSVQG